MGPFQPSLFEKHNPENTWQAGDCWQRNIAEKLRKFLPSIIGSHVCGISIDHDLDMAGTYDETKQFSAEVLENSISFMCDTTYYWNLASGRSCYSDHTSRGYIDLQNPHTITHKDAEDLDDLISSILLRKSITLAVETLKFEPIRQVNEKYFASEYRQIELGKKSQTKLVHTEFTGAQYGKSSVSVKNKKNIAGIKFDTASGKIHLRDSINPEIAHETYQLFNDAIKKIEKHRNKNPINVSFS